VEFWIADTGIGISREGQERLFTEFFREKRAEGKYVVGTGSGPFQSTTQTAISFASCRILLLTLPMRNSSTRDSPLRPTTIVP